MKPGKDILKSIIDPFEPNSYYDNSITFCPYVYRALGKSVEQFIRYSVYSHVNRTVWSPIQASIVVRIRGGIRDGIGLQIRNFRRIR